MDRKAACLSSTRPIVSKIANKFQITVPGEIRAIFDLREGDFFEWILNKKDLTLTLVPKRPQLITPLLDQQVLAERSQRAKGQGREINAKVPRKGSPCETSTQELARSEEGSQALIEA